MECSVLPHNPSHDDPLIVYLIVRKDLNMGPGKIGAQCGHAVHLLKRAAETAKSIVEIHRTSISNERQCTNSFLNRMDLWENRPDNGGFTKIVLGAHDKDWFKLKDQYNPIIVVDAGNTEVDPGTETVMILFPMFKSERNSLLKRQRLL